MRFCRRWAGNRAQRGDGIEPNGALVRHNVKLIGANAPAIAKGEDRQLFKEAMSGSDWMCRAPGSRITR